MDFEPVLTRLLGGSGEDLTALHMAARVVVIYVVTLAMIRVGKRRFMGEATAFDVIVGIMLGSIVSRAVTGNAPFLPALAAAATLLAMHWLFSWLTVRSDRMGRWVKGRARTLVRNGAVDAEALQSSLMTMNDLEVDLRSQGVSCLADVAEARLERNGKVSVIRKT